ncbi:TonB-dependent receptor plug domain-containing protein [Roseicyclus sp.]|uniref:TonB-dependent receptor plug domain-containing protein n=1 Tax=Roseicyclus sp. TaxID=1914329 RepID=UPI003F9ED334
MNRFLSGVAVAALCVAPAAAQDAFMLDDIVFSVGLTPVGGDRTGVTFDVLSAEDLAFSGNAQLSDRLATVPGVSLSQNGPVGSQTTLRIRGLNSNYIPVYLNGIDITDPASTQTSFDFGALAGTAASRVEILRGSQGPIYGSEAIAGVVSIDSDLAPDAPGTEVTLGLEAGSYDTWIGTFGVGTRSEFGTLSFSATRLETEGFSAADENAGNTEADGHRSTTLTLTGEYLAGEDVTLGFSAFWIDSYSEFDGFPAPAFTLADTADVTEAERYGARVYVGFDAFGLEHELALSGSRTDRFFPGGFTENFRGDRATLSWIASADLGADASLSFGIDATREKFATDSDRGTVDTTAIFGEYLAALTPEFDLSASIRYDEHSLFGGQTTGRLAAAWRPAEGTLLRGALATGFRAPSLFELYSGAFGNPNLVPEESLSLEFGIDQTMGDLTLGATLFYTEIDNLIGFAGGGYTQVPGTSTTRGIELTADYALTDALTLFGNHTYTDAVDRNGNRLVRVPRNDTTLGVAGEFGLDWSGSFTVQHVADRVEGGAPLADYTLANAQIGYGLTETTEVYLRIENLFDEEYQTARGYGTSDRAFYIGIRSRF